MKNILAFVVMLICLPAIATEGHSISNLEKATRTELNDVHRSVLRRFRYKEVLQVNEKFMYYDSDDRIIGDCDDFASAVYFELWKRHKQPIIYVYDSTDFHNKPYRHVIVCAEGFCFDNNRDNIFSQTTFNGRLEKRYELVVSGELNEEMMQELLNGDSPNGYESNIYTTGAKTND